MNYLPPVSSPTLLLFLPWQEPSVEPKVMLPPLRAEPLLTPPPSPPPLSVHPDHTEGTALANCKEKKKNMKLILLKNRSQTILLKNRSGSGFQEGDGNKDHKKKL